MELPPPRAVVLCDPSGFDVVEAANPHTLVDGQLQSVERAQARAQWQAVHDAYASIGMAPLVVPASQGLPDQVFTANPVFAYPARDGTPSFLRSRMTYASRQPEVDALAAFLQANGLTAVDVPGTQPLEGGGDLLWKGSERWLIGGHGFRSSEAAIHEAARVVDAPLTSVRLVDERYYHLDTCLAVLDSRTALWWPDAFDDASWWRLQDAFDTLIEVPPGDAATFACNAHCPDGHHVIMDMANQDTAGLLADHGYEPILVNTSEFRKSGGSVYCMKQVVW